ncbi:MAG TPA: DNA primase, partial [Acholeplasmataceae bacterium]|nr:DNA primase [Acholeplasmataceae bacterium]
ITQKEVITQKNQKYYNILEDSTQFYNFYLQNTVDGQVALKYLHNRGLNTNIINRFRIGLSSSDRDDLYKYLTQKGHLPIDIVEVGLVRSGDEYYDTFRNRIMFPLTDLDGRVVGFSGRTYTDSNEPKYINSSENIVFQKGKILYNYYEALPYIKEQDQVFLFEGFMDVIAAYRAKINNAVASMGTSLSLEQAKALKRATNNVVICYDGDDAGIAATKRAINILLKETINVTVVSISDNLDPDDYLKKYGEEKLHKLLSQTAISAIEFIYLDEKKQLVAGDINSIETFKRTIFENLHLFNSNVITEMYLKKMADDLGVSIESLYADFRNQPRKVIRIKPVKITKDDKISLKKYDLIQKELIHFVLTHPEKCIEIENRFQHNYVCDEYRDIMFEIYQYYTLNQTIDPQDIKSRLNDKLALIFEEIMNLDYPKEIEEVELLLKEFSGFPYAKENIKLIGKSNKTLDDLNKYGYNKKNLIKIKIKTKE